MNRFWSMLIIAGVLLFSPSCAYLKQLSALKQCEFRHGTLENPILADASKKPTRVGLKIKPYIRIGERDLVYPGYIKIKHEFGAEE